MEGFSSFDDAKQACIDDDMCKGFFDVNCEGFLYWICRGNITLGFEESDIDYTGFHITPEYEATSTCAWEKGTNIKMTVTLCFQTRK